MDLTKLQENTLYIYKNSCLEIVDKPVTGFGKTIVHWQDDKPISQEIVYTKRMNEK